jgi:4-hydroxythreonine-4-phosphate dehydrogenase
MLLFGDAVLLRRQAQEMGLSPDFEVVAPEELPGGGRLPERGIVNVPARREQIEIGRGTAAGGEAAARNIEECVRACRSGMLDAMVTAPLNKQHFNEAGFHFPGHTEFLAHLAGARRVAMAFLTERLKVVLVTIHLPLREAIDRVTSEAILEKLEIVLAEFPRLGLPCGRVAVAGLNPHAGEAGLLGSEETERIVPALEVARLRHAGVRIEGPLPADTLFHRAAGGEFDVVLALYHDQGLIPVKLIGFGEAVNVTLGLPFVRVSVDHGTAYDIAGTGRARADSMISAIRWALRLVVPMGRGRGSEARGLHVMPGSPDS